MCNFLHEKKHALTLVLEHGGGYEVILLSRVYVEWERRYVLIRLTKGIML